MKTNNVIPHLPENAPFTSEQRAWLNGFLTGLFSRAAIPGQMPPASQALKPLTILFGSQTGTAEGLARRVAAEAGKRGFVPSVVDLGEYRHENLKEENQVLILTSTYGEGEPPDNARGFWKFLHSDRAPSLKTLQFSVLGLGDRKYSSFCQCAKDFDQRLEALGGRRSHPRMDCDVDDEGSFLTWLGGVLSALEGTPSSATPQPDATPSTATPAAVDSPRQPFPARLCANRRLNGEGSGKDTRHFEISIEGSDLVYETGDALGVVPSNCPELVEDLLRALGHRGDETVSIPESRQVPLREALLRHGEITRIPIPLLEAVARQTRDPVLLELAGPSRNGHLARYLDGRDILDLLREFTGARFSPEELVALLKPNPPRLYSISSSPKAHPGAIHLTVAVVRSTSLGRARKGVCSTFLAERVAEGTPVPVFVRPNKGFRMPADGNRPLLMIGPGTGVAPFRAFLQERQATGAKGKSWLFFGDQHAATDFLYREELEAMRSDGTLTRLDTAFSRDQAHKVYVQTRMLENAREFFAWLEEGGHLYVCGDAHRMAKDVDAALHQIIEQAGGRTRDQAVDYVDRLRAEKRYQRDVY